LLHYYEGTVFNAPVKTIVNTVNCTGFMGAGIALEFKLRYPLMYEDYKTKCERKEVKIGRPYLFEQSDDLWILNFPTKVHWKYPSRMKWIEEGLRYFTSKYNKLNFKSIAFPKLGCSNGGLKWSDVKPIMESYLSDLDVDVYICLDEKTDAEGVEMQMIQCINDTTKSALIKNVGLNSKQAEIILASMPFKRVRQIYMINGIGDATYSKIFTYFFNAVTNKVPLTEVVDYKQQSLFGEISLQKQLELSKKRKR
jgi:O-acetyl-ADP-ribose deacetylase (regulator of RNase III)